MERKVALVTGVASGIGKKIAQELVDLGHIVYGIDINECDLRGGVSKKIDVTDENSVNDYIDNIVKKYEGLDFVVNAAGVISKTKCFRLKEVPKDEWDMVMSVNLYGAFVLAKCCVGRINPYGCIINFSSEQVIQPNLKSVPYAISKNGIEMLNKVIDMEGKDNKVRSNVIALGSVKTNFIKHMTDSEEAFIKKIVNTDQNMAFGIIEVEDVWKCVRFVLFDALKMTGQTILIDSGMTVN